MIGATFDTFITPEPPFEEIKHLMSKMPLRFPPRLTPEQIEALQDEFDVEDSINALKEHGSISLKDLKNRRLL